MIRASMGPLNPKPYTLNSILGTRILELYSDSYSDPNPPSPLNLLGVGRSAGKGGRMDPLCSP